MDPRYFSDDDFGRIICEAFHDHRDMGAVNWNAVARTVRAQLKAETWLSIETAPFGQELLVWHVAWPAPSVAWWTEEGDDYDWPSEESPSHWMPLPDPPEAPKP